MPTLQIDVSDADYQQLGKLAEAMKQPAEKVVGAHVRQWLGGHQDRFRQALSAVLQENEELYRRLA